MAKGANARQRRLFKALIAELEPKMKSAFLQSIAEAKQDIDWEALINALTARNVDAAIAALNMEPAAFQAYYSAKAAAFEAGGVLAAKTINPPPIGKVAFRFDMSNPQAEAWIKQNVANLIAERSDEVKAKAREVIYQGYAKGRHPNDIARDLAGRMENGRRKGGAIFLGDQLEGYAASMRRRLESGDASEIAKIKMMRRRDHTFDNLLDAAIAGRKLSDSDINRMVARYEDRLLAYRAETIARTETGMAVMSGRRQEWQQAADKLGYDPTDAVIKTWRHGGGVREPRVDHQMMNGVSVTGLNTPFKFGSVEMQHALDPAGGAEHCANCTCDTDYRLDHTAGLT